MSKELKNSKKADLNSEDFVIEFLEPADAPEGLTADDAGGIVEFVEDLDMDNLGSMEKVNVDDVGDELSELLSDDIAEDVSEFISEYSDEVSETILVPGTQSTPFHNNDEPTEEVETSWHDDRDPAKFMEYLTSAYPAGIPQHDGNSMVGCERAALYLTRLNNEISEALRLDSDDTLDPVNLEDYRVKIMSDLVLLKNRLSDLKKQLNQSERDKLASSGEKFVKEATTPNIQLVVTPFERAVTGILVNSVVSAGKPFESVYSYLKDKYSLTDREELTIMQLLMDSGYHIFKDRGTIGSPEGSVDAGGNPESYGVDYIKNYFS